MGQLLKKLRFKAKNFRKDREGATAVEFAILFVPFSAMMFAIIELGIVFFIQTTVAHAMNQAAREVRTGNFQSTGATAAAFESLVCERMAGLGDCSNLRIDVVTSDNDRFDPNILPPTQGGDIASPDDPPQPPSTYVQTPPRAVVVVRAQYFHNLAFPGAYTKLSNASGNTRIIESVTAFRNEPFPG
jgi:Flp pilus assembly protein TadG